MFICDCSTESHDNPFVADGELRRKADYILMHSIISRAAIRISDPDVDDVIIDDDSDVMFTYSSGGGGSTVNDRTTAEHDEHLGGHFETSDVRDNSMTSQLDVTDRNHYSEAGWYENNCCVDRCQTVAHTTNNFTMHNRTDESQLVDVHHTETNGRIPELLSSNGGGIHDPLHANYGGIHDPLLANGGRMHNPLLVNGGGIHDPFFTYGGGIHDPLLANGRRIHDPLPANGGGIHEPLLADDGDSDSATKCELSMTSCDVKNKKRNCCTLQ